MKIFKLGSFHYKTLFEARKDWEEGVVICLRREDGNSSASLSHDFYKQE